ncbi:unnamed protein product [Protopolystoma xenopodis]|uniref:Fibronectin type-III domain-containing protein n=1 Tax=Protopolystoma xenopodis TaxID=117903 RepID=A0A3S5ARX6_9PLAT|nr:unnamed protein product [Protopolystoma xenopodis]
MFRQSFKHRVIKRTGEGAVKSRNNFIIGLCLSEYIRRAMNWLIAGTGYQVEKRTPKGKWTKATASLVPGTTVSITGLEEGSDYEFRVMGVNDAGLGDPSKTTPPQTIKDPTFPPGSPENLTAQTINKNGVTLAWQKPRSDGGAKVTGYLIERKGESGEWELARHCPADSTQAWVPMQEGEKCQFRVKAINPEGEGEPSKPTSVITANNQEAAPSLMGTSDAVGGEGSGVGGLKDITIKVYLANSEKRIQMIVFFIPYNRHTQPLNNI